MSGAIKPDSTQHKGHLAHLKKEEAATKPENKPEIKIETETKTKKEK